jgi:hypothetical protein
MQTFPETKPKDSPEHEVKPLGCWFTIARVLRHTCCKCGASHVFEFRLRGKSIQMRVQDEH